MADRQINDNAIKALLAEASANRLFLRALIEAVLSPEHGKAWEELEAMIFRVEAIAKVSAVQGVQKQSSDMVMRAATNMAVEFLRSIGPKPVRQ